MPQRKLKMVNKKKKTKKKCKHKNVDYMDCPCPNCGYQEAVCKDCGKELAREMGEDWDEC